MNVLEKLEEEIKQKLEEIQKLFDSGDDDYMLLTNFSGQITAYLYVLSMINKLKGD